MGPKRKFRLELQSWFITGPQIQLPSKPDTDMRRFRQRFLCLGLIPAGSKQDAVCHCALPRGQHLTAGAFLPATLVPKEGRRLSVPPGCPQTRAVHSRGLVCLHQCEPAERSLKPVRTWSSCLRASPWESVCSTQQPPRTAKPLQPVCPMTAKLISRKKNLY